MAERRSVMVDVQNDRPTGFESKMRENRQMARAAIRLCLKHGITDREIIEEYRAIQASERGREER